MTRCDCCKDEILPIKCKPQQLNFGYFRLRLIKKAGENQLCSLCYTSIAHIYSIGEDNTTARNIMRNSPTCIVDPLFDHDDASEEEKDIWSLDNAIQDAFMKRVKHSLLDDKLKDITLPSESLYAKIAYRRLVSKVNSFSKTHINYTSLYNQFNNRKMALAFGGLVTEEHAMLSEVLNIIDKYQQKTRNIKG